MTIESAITSWLEENSSLDAWWFERPKKTNQAIIFRCISPSIISGNLAKSNLRRDLFSFTVYHDDIEIAKAEADALVKNLHDFSGDLNGCFVQLIEFENGFDQILYSEPGLPVYQFNRDFLITY